MRIHNAQSSRPVTVLQWTLRHGSDALACEVNARSPRSFDVSVTPLQHGTSTVTEHFGSVVRAMRRHAEIVGMLRALGWNATDYCHPHPARAAA